MKKRNLSQSIFLVAVLLFFLLGCANKDLKTLKTIEGDPQPLYKEGLALFNKRNYSEALKKFEQVKSNFPDSPPFTSWAELKAADCHFFKGEYVEAIAGYEEFKKIHPTHEEIPYVQYQIGMGYFNQVLTLDRDQTFTRKALSSFEYLIANDGASLFTEKAREKVGVLRKRLADHEFYIGNFYYKNRKYQAAASRFQNLVEMYPKVSDEDQTLMLLAKSYIELGEGEKAKAPLTRIVTEYSRSGYYKEAKAILDRGATEKKPGSRKPAMSGGAAEESESSGAQWQKVVVSRFEEEKRRPVSLKEETGVGAARSGETIVPLSATVEGAGSVPPVGVREKESLPVAPSEPIGEQRAKVAPQNIRKEKGLEEPLKLALVPSDEPQKALPPGGKALPPKIEVQPEGERRMAVLPNGPPPSEGRTRKEGPLDPGKPLLAEKGQPIDITSDRVETYSKENLIIFKGNVAARQKDMVIYADDVEAVVAENGKGIDRVTAGGNVKIQQGLRVASCEKAVFHNSDQKIVLTGDPKVWEGESMVSGDEIVFYIEQNRVEVRGGPGVKGKAQIRSKGDLGKRE
jgi:outer membrane protein assembly factor BamD